MNIKRIQHVSISRPSGTDQATRAFYGRVLGLEEIEVPESLQDMDLIWYQIGNQEIHLIGDDIHEDRPVSHFCIEVDDVEAVRSALLEGGHEPSDTVPIHNRPRFFCQDPFGNRIEFTEIQGDYRGA